MAGSRHIAFPALAFLLLSVSGADAFGWRGCRESWYYVPAPCCQMPICIPFECAPIFVRPVPRAMPLADQKPAPPSANEPPLGTTPKRAPTITESRSQAGNYTQAVGQPVSERCLIGFWNMSGRDVTLKINGQTRLLAKDRAVNLQLDRAFVWQVDHGEPTAERVPPGLRRHEVMIRQ